MKIGIHVVKEDWILDRIASEFSRRWSDYVVDDIDKADVLWLLSPLPGRVLWNLDIPVVTSIQHIDKTKYSHAYYEALDNNTTCYLTSCSKTKSFMKSKKEFSKDVTVLPYWVNKELWYPLPKKTSRDSIGMGNINLADSYVIGSFQRDTEGSDLSSPKLSKGPDRFCDYVERVQSLRGDVHVLLGGWRRQYVINRLTEKGIPFTYLERPSVDKVNLMYNACDLYVVGSRCEGGPQAILECAATRTPIVSTNVGIASEILSPSCIIDIHDTIYFPEESDIDHAYNAVSQRSLDLDLGYVDFFKSLVK